MGYQPPPYGPPPPPPGGYSFPPGGGVPPGGYGSSGDYGRPSEPPASDGLVIGSLVASVLSIPAVCLTVALALPLPLAALVLSIVAVVQRGSNPSVARTCAYVAYGCVAVGVAIGVVIFFTYFTIGFLEAV